MNWLALLAETFGKVGQTEEGLTVLAEALAVVRKNEKRYYEAELYRLKGELLLKTVDSGQESENSSSINPQSATTPLSSPLTKGG